MKPFREFIFFIFILANKGKLLSKRYSSNQYRRIKPIFKYQKTSSAQILISKPKNKLILSPSNFIFDKSFTSMINPNDKQDKREIKEKLQKKLELRQLTLYDALQEDLSVDWFKQSNPAFLALLSPQGMKQVINYVVIPGPEQNKIRSFKIPMIATEILSTPCPKMFELMFTEDKQARGGCTLGWLIEYFWRNEPNYVISGYVTKILNNLIPGNPHKVLEYMIRNACPQMILYLESHSVAEFLLRMIIVEDILLNAFIKERLQLFNQLVEMYVQNKAAPEVLENVNYMLCESFTRLWAQKNKELGRFSSSLLRMVQVVIDYDDKYQEEKFLPIIVKLMADHGNIAPAIVMVIYRKIYKRLSTLKPKKMRYQNKESIETFSSLNFCLLETIQCIVNSFPQEFGKFLEKQNIFLILIAFVKRFEWNSIVLVQIEKIIKHSIAKKDAKIYKSLIEPLIDAIKQWKDTLSEAGKFGRGYKGFLTSIQKFLNENLQHNTAFKQYLQKSSLLAKYERTISKVDLIKEENEGFRVVHNIAIPSYKSVVDLVSEYSEFFLETEAINKKYQMQNPADHIKHKEDDVLINEIENENQLVYKLLTQLTVPTGGSASEENEKKTNDEANGNQ